MKLTLLLCDHVAVAEGKLYISGGGWTMTGPDPAPSGIAVLLEVPWDQANRSIALRLGLFHEDGQPVAQMGPDGVTAVEVGADLEVGRPPGLPAGTPLPVPLAVNLPPIPLPPGQGYFWQAEIGGERRADWRLSFRTRPAADARPAATDPAALPDF